MQASITANFYKHVLNVKLDDEDDSGEATLHKVMGLFNDKWQYKAYSDYKFVDCFDYVEGKRVVSIEGCTDDPDTCSHAMIMNAIAASDMFTAKRAIKLPMMTANGMEDCIIMAYFTDSYYYERHKAQGFFQLVDKVERYFGNHMIQGGYLRIDNGDSITTSDDDPQLHERLTLGQVFDMTAVYPLVKPQASTDVPEERLHWDED